MKPLSARAALAWWESWRLRFAARALHSNREKLEKCWHFDGSESALGANNVCPTSTLAKLSVAWIDWSGRDFAYATLGDSATEAAITQSYLVRASFTGSRAVGARFDGSILRHANFTNAVLTHADFTSADLQDANFAGADVTDIRLAFANLDTATWEPKPGTLPNIGSVATAINIQGLQYQQSPQQLSELRDALYKAGLSVQAQKVTYAIEHTRRILDSESNDVLESSLSLFRFVAFELPVGYGMYPLRSIFILLALIPVFALLYFIAIIRTGARGLWIRRIEVDDRAPVEWQSIARTVYGESLDRWAVYCGFALWYSTICAFRIGFRDVNAGEWIARLQPSEFLLTSTGWCRTVAGIQSLLSVYLLALTVLCIVGRPFG